MKKHSAAALLSLLAYLWSAGCTVQSGEAPEPRGAVPLGAGEFGAGAAMQGEPGPLAGPVESGWLQDFESPELEALVDEALANSPSLAVAAANLERSQAIARQAGAALQPQVAAGLGGSATARGDGTSASNFGASLDVSWELDLWGKLSSTQQAATLEALAAQEDFRYARESLAAQVCKAYFLAVGLKLQLGLAREIYASYEETVRVVGARADVGDVDRRDLFLAEGEKDSAQNDLLEAEGAYRDALRSLEILLGRYPGTDIEVAADLPRVSGPVPAGLPSELLERRPDLIAAERRVAAAFNATNAARAARLPSLSLSASAGGASDSLGDVLSPSNLFANFGANLLGPLFDGGYLKSEEDITRAEQKIAFEQYREAALSAMRDVESALDTENLFAGRESALSRAEENLGEAFQIVRAQYEVGEGDILDTLATQRRYAATQGAHLGIRQGRLVQRVNLYLALGGSFEEAPQPAEGGGPAAP